MAKKSKERKKKKGKKDKSKKKDKSEVEEVEEVEEEKPKKKKKKGKKDKKEKKKKKDKTEKKKKTARPRLSDLSDRPEWQTASKAKKLPSTGKADSFQQFAVAVAKLNSGIYIHKGKNGFSLHHPDHPRMVIGVGGSKTTIRLTSKFFDPKKDKGCERDPKKYPTVVLENSTPAEVADVAKIALKRAKLV